MSVVKNNTNPNTANKTRLAVRRGVDRGAESLLGRGPLHPSVGLSAMCNKWTSERLSGFLPSTWIKAEGPGWHLPRRLIATLSVSLSDTSNNAGLRRRHKDLTLRSSFSVYYQALLSEVYTIQEASGLKSVTKHTTLQQWFFFFFI